MDDNDDDDDDDCTDVVLLHGCPQSSMPNPVEGLLEVYEDMVEVLPVLEIFLTEDSKVEGHHQQVVECLLLENFVFWQCSLLIGNTINLAVVLSI